jgi:hypothetical protein
VASLGSLSRRIELLELQAPKKPKVDAAEVERRMAERMRAYERENQAYEALSVPEKVARKRQELETLRAAEPSSGLMDARWTAYRVSMADIAMQELEGVGPEIIDSLRCAAHSALSGRKMEPASTDRQTHDKPPPQASEQGLPDEIDPDHLMLTESTRNAAARVMRVVMQDKLADFRDDDSRRRWEP